MSANLSLFAASAISQSAGILTAARALVPALAKGKTLDRNGVRDAMTFAFMGRDTEGLWQWKDAYDAIEVAQVLHLRKIAYPVARLEDAPAETVFALRALNRLGLTHTRRSEEQVALDQFSTPPELAALAVLAAQIRSGDTVLEPSAGTGILAMLAELAGAQLHLNELAPTRSDLLDAVFPPSVRTRLPERACRVKRLRAPDGQTWLGRVFTEADALRLLQQLGVADIARDIANPVSGPGPPHEKRRQSSPGQRPAHDALACHGPVSAGNRQRGL